MGGGIVVASKGQNYYKVSMHEEQSAMRICNETVTESGLAGCASLGGLTEGPIVFSRPNSVLVFTDGSRVIKSARIKSKKLGSLVFGTLFALDSQRVLSVSQSHITMLDFSSIKVLHCHKVDSIEKFSFNKAEKVLTALSVRDGSVKVERYKVMTLVESLTDYVTVNMTV